MKSLLTKIIVSLVSLVFAGFANNASFANDENHYEYTTNNTAQEHIVSQDCSGDNCEGCDSEEVCCGSELSCFAHCEYTGELISQNSNPPKFDYYIPHNNTVSRIFYPPSLKNADNYIHSSAPYISYQKSQFPEYLVGILILVI